MGTTTPVAGADHGSARGLVLHAGARRPARRRRHRGAPVPRERLVGARAAISASTPSSSSAGSSSRACCSPSGRSAQRIDLKAFWIRRARRLLPAVLVVVAAIARLRRHCGAAGGAPPTPPRCVLHPRVRRQLEPDLLAPVVLRAVRGAVAAAPRLVARDRRAVLPALAARRVRAAARRARLASRARRRPARCSPPARQCSWRCSTNRAPILRACTTAPTPARSRC